MRIQNTLLLLPAFIVATHATNYDAMWDQAMDAKDLQDADRYAADNQPFPSGYSDAAQQEYTKMSAEMKQVRQALYDASPPNPSWSTFARGEYDKVRNRVDNCEATKGKCEDGYEPGFFGCCGVGACNLACGDCDGGCRWNPNGGGTRPVDICLKDCDAAMKSCIKGSVDVGGGMMGSGIQGINQQFQCKDVQDGCIAGCNIKYPKPTRRLKTREVVTADHNVFARLGANSTDSMTLQEWNTLLESKALDLEEGKKVFDLFDVDGNGVLTLQEAEERRHR